MRPGRSCSRAAPTCGGGRGRPAGGPPPLSLPAAPRALAGAAALLFVAYGHVWAVPALEIGLAVGLALTAGAVAWELIRPEGTPPDRSQVPGQVLVIVQGILLGAPVLFHALRLALR